MPTSYAGADAFPTTYLIPSDGDALNAASTNVAHEALGDRTTWLKNRTGAKWLVNEGNLTLQASVHTWPNGDSFTVANQRGLVAAGGTDTPFTSGVLSGDILEIDFAQTVSFFNEVADPTMGASFRLMYSETAADFVTGTWAPVISAAFTQKVVFLPGTPDGITALLQWSFALAPAGTTGHVRFAIASLVTGYHINNADGGSGRWRWLRTS